MRKSLKNAKVLLATILVVAILLCSFIFQGARGFAEEKKVLEPNVKNFSLLLHPNNFPGRDEFKYLDFVIDIPFAEIDMNDDVKETVTFEFSFGEEWKEYVISPDEFWDDTSNDFSYTFLSYDLVEAGLIAEKDVPKFLTEPTFYRLKIEHNGKTSRSNTLVSYHIEDTVQLSPNSPGGEGSRNDTVPLDDYQGKVGALILGSIILILCVTSAILIAVISRRKKMRK